MLRACILVLCLAVLGVSVPCLFAGDTVSEINQLGSALVTSICAIGAAIVSIVQEIRHWVNVIRARKGLPLI